jgi:hypothetical protein
MKSPSQLFFENHAAKLVLLFSAAVGIGSFAYYYSHGLSTVHYDAKAHLVVARRMVDSTTPGYAQMGAHWLPLIHLLYLPFVLIPSQYYTALVPSLISVFAFALSGWLIYRISYRLTSSIPAGLFAASVLIGNANLQFLQSAPLTEPIYLALFLLSFDQLVCWREQAGDRAPWISALWAALAALCRYEGWVFLAGVVALIAYDGWCRRYNRRRAVKAIAVFTGVFAIPVVAHFGYIYSRLGDSFFQRVARGNPAPYETYHRPLLSVVYHFGELAQAVGLIPLFVALAGLIGCLSARERLSRYLPYLLLWLPSLINAPALYWGLIYRVRYSALLVPAVAVFGSLILTRNLWTRRILVSACVLAILLPWVSSVFPAEWKYHFMSPSVGMFALPSVALCLFLAAVASARYGWALIVLAAASMQLPVLEGEYRPMLGEALEHQYIEPEQKEVLQYLLRNYDHSRILIDIGRLAPLIYDSRLQIREFVYHDGDRRDWDRASVKPRSYVGWLCAEKGDEIWEWLRVDPHRADGYALAVKTENYLLYRWMPEIGKADLSTGKLP